MRLYRPPLRALDAAHAAAAELPTRGVAAATTKMAAMDCGAWELLDGCDVTWRPSGSGFRGTMRAGGCVITSQYNASRSMLIKDDLGLSAEALCVDDRGYDGATGAQIYGSKEGVPYRMERVLVPSPLEWTLGEAFKLADGPSAR
ncbi:hypothetical protein M885DRAFT_506781 [Pelagophyceae sp. CCMP2097]|nr:hypothetical protein M885DRAFT_506781 [Pelagophyceae sp. CCMP2097]